jgi:hypothetical protein
MELNTISYRSVSFLCSFQVYHAPRAERVNGLVAGKGFSMSNDKKIQAIREYLQEEFPGAVIEDRREPDEKAYVFRIGAGTVPHVARITDPFLAGCEAPKVASRLRAFTLAEHLRDMGGTAIVVTPDGLKLEGD